MVMTIALLRKTLPPGEFNQKEPEVSNGLATESNSTRIISECVILFGLLCRKGVSFAPGGASCCFINTVSGGLRRPAMRSYAPLGLFGSKLFYRAFSVPLGT
jgi:hypothetical protein